MNRVILTNARITKDLELKFGASGGTAILDFTVAVQREFKKEETDFINCVAFGKTAETIAKYFHKGSVIAVEGSLQVSSYENKEGNRIYSTKVVVNRMEFPQGNKKDGEQGTSNKTNNNPIADLTEVDDQDIPF